MGTPLDDVKKVINKGDGLAKKRDLLEAKIKDIHKKLEKMGARDKGFAPLVESLEKHAAELAKVAADHAKMMLDLAKQARAVGS